MARPAGLGRGRMPGLLAGGRWRAGLLEGDARSACWDRGLPGSSGGAAADAGVGPPGRDPRPRGPPDRTRSPAFCGQLRVGWRFCEPADPQAKGAVERLQGYAETNFEPGRRFANELDFQVQLDGWFDEGERADAQDAARPTGRPAREEHGGDGAAARGDARRDRRWVLRVPPDPYLRVDTNDYSLDPVAGRPPRRGPRQPARDHRASLLDTGELACRHPRVFAAPDDHRARARPRAEGATRAPPAARDGESRCGRSLARYDALIA